MAACQSCGASLQAGAERCDLCGTPVDVGAHAATPAPAPAPGTVYCIACGHPNLPEARYCNRCGTAMPSVDAAPSNMAPAPANTTPSADARAAGPVDDPDSTSPALPPEREGVGDRPSSAPGRRALWMVGIGLLAVLALYLLLTGGRDDPPPPSPAPSAAAPAPGAAGAVGEPVVDPESVADLALSPELQRDAEAAAALVAGAEQANTAAAWDDAGRLYLDLTRRADPALRPTLARQAIAAFTRSLAVEDSPDVRTRRVSAYRYDPSTTMQPVTELQQVLTANPRHPEANFQMGELRLQIGRADSAVASFARAAAAAPAGGPLQRDAQMMMEQARQAAAAPATPAPGGG